MSEPDIFEPVRILAHGRDATLTCEILAGSGIACEIVSTSEVLGRDLEEVQVLIVAEEELTPSCLAAMADPLARQPPWSDLPIIVVAKSGGRAGQAMRAVEALGNVSVLARPLCIDALITAVHSGMRARRRQFQVRDLLRERDEADRRKDEFLAMLAHELRNPLAPIRGAVGLMRMLEVENPDLVEARDVLDRQVRHMARLIDDLLDVSRITRGTIELRTRRIDVVEVARNAARMASSAMQARGHRFQQELPTVPIPVEADPTRLEQVITNLLSNAAKYTEPGGTVRLAVEYRHPEAVIRVSDNGIGIDPRVLPHVFELFAQADRSLDRSQGGLGIGLTIVKRMVELHGGTVQAISDGTGLGTEVVVRLPVTTEPDHRNGFDHNSRVASNGTALRVLLVEDNQDAAKLLARALRLCGHELRVAYDGLSALATASGFRPQVVISDIGLPGLDGYELARRLRRSPTLGHPLLVAVSGYGRAEDTVIAREAGFDYHLVKPVDVESLTSLMSRAQVSIRTDDGLVVENGT